MKKLFAFLLILALLFCLSGCGNMSIGFGNFEFNHIHVCDYSGKCVDLTVEKWYDDSEGVEVFTSECGSLFLSEGTYIMYSDTCPLCSKED